MPRRLDFRILGTLEVRDGDERLALGGRRQRAVLALLLLHRGEIVSSERLIDLLWGGAPPGTAATALQGYVSQLRKVLEPDRPAGAAPRILVTHEPGYVLRVAPEQLDLERFNALVSGARTALAAGRADEASAALERALGLWRGPALADLENEPFAQGEAGRLEELRVAALEERFDAELTRGRHHELIAALEAHIARHPLRERPRGQLMLALYRAGRQAEALGAFQDARRTLVDEVGIEPGSELRRLEQAILEQAPELAPPPRPRSPPSTEQQATPEPRVAVPRRRPRRGPALGALLAAAAAVAAVALVATRDGDGPAAAIVRADSVAEIDVGSARVIRSIAIGGTPTSVSAGEGGVWVLNADRQVISRIDPRSGALRTFGTGGLPTDLAAGAGALWVANGAKGDAQFVGPLATTVSSIDADSSAIRATVELPRRPGRTSNANASRLVATRDAVWVVNPDFSVSRIDPGTTQITATSTNVSAVAVAAGDEGIWVLNDDNSLQRVGAGAGAAPVRVATNGLSALAVGAGAVWATAPYDGVLWRVDPQPRLLQRTIPVGIGASAVTVGGGAVWVLNALRGTVAKVDPRSNRVIATIALGGTPRRAAVAGDRLWVSVAGTGDVPSASGISPGIDALPSATCGRVFYGGAGHPDRLIVSDLPLRGGPQLPARQMSQAIAFVLRQREFRAGTQRVAYQSCDDSTAQSGIFDREKCAANAKAYAAEPTVIGVVGPLNSGCAVQQIPIANRAGLALLSPTSTEVALTRAEPNAPEGALRALYPTGRRNFARLLPSEAAQGAADALLARRLGARRVAVLSDGGYGETLARYFARAARTLGLRVTVARRWDPRAAGYRDLAGAVARRRPDAVFVSGLLDTNGGEVIKELRGRLAPEVALIGVDGLLPVSRLHAIAGRAARGVYLSLPGLAPEGLGPEGRAFVRAFAATQPGAVVHRQSVYAAAAAATLLDAIAAADGTRAGVTRTLLATRARRGILGTFALDAAGDVTPSPITIVRVRRGGGDDTVESIDGAAIDRVIRPPRFLLR